MTIFSRDWLPPPAPSGGWRWPKTRTRNGWGSIILMTGTCTATGSSSSSSSSPGNSILHTLHQATYQGNRRGDVARADDSLRAWLSSGGGHIGKVQFLVLAALSLRGAWFNQRPSMTAPSRFAAHSLHLLLRLVLPRRFGLVLPRRFGLSSTGVQNSKTTGAFRACFPRSSWLIFSGTLISRDNWWGWDCFCFSSLAAAARHGPKTAVWPRGSLPFYSRGRFTSVCFPAQPVPLCPTTRVCLFVRPSKPFA